MPPAQQTTALPRVTTRSAAPFLQAAGPWLLGFAPIALLGFEGGGFDVISRSQVGVALWWLVLVAAAIGIVRRPPQSLALRIGVGGLVALGAWTLLSAAWSDDPEFAVGEAARYATLLGLLPLALSVERDRLRFLAYGVFAAMATLLVAAFMSRVDPSLFSGATDTDAFFSKRLSWPLNYWNSLGALAAMALVLGLGAAQAATSAAGRAAVLAPLPVVSLVAYMTLSRGAIVATAVGLVVLFFCSRDLPGLLWRMALTGFGSAVLIAGAEQRDDFRQGLESLARSGQNDEMLALAAVVVVGTAFVALGADLLLRTISKRLSGAGRVDRGLKVTASIALVAALIGVVATQDLGQRWDSFTTPTVQKQDSARLTDLSSNGRYQLWSSAYDQFKTEPLVGSGVGSFHGWWSQNGTFQPKIQNAHAFHMDVLAETGLVGAAFLLLFLGGLAVAAITGIRRTDRPQLPLAAGAIAAVAACATTAAFDWSWQVTVLPAAALALLAFLIGQQRPAGAAAQPAGRGERVLLILAAVAAFAVLLVPLSSASNLRASQTAALEGDLSEAYSAALAAERVAPYAAGPLLQQALVLEEAGDFDRAAAAARAAAGKAPSDWGPQLVLARVEALRGDADASVAALRRARALNPNSPAVRP